MSNKILRSPWFYALRLADKFAPLSQPMRSKPENQSCLAGIRFTLVTFICVEFLLVQFVHCDMFASVVIGLSNSPLSRRSLGLSHGGGMRDKSKTRLRRRLAE